MIGCQQLQVRVIAVLIAWQQLQQYEGSDDRLEQWKLMVVSWFDYFLKCGVERNCEPLNHMFFLCCLYDVILGEFGLNLDRSIGLYNKGHKHLIN